MGSTAFSFTKPHIKIRPAQSTQDWPLSGGAHLAYGAEASVGFPDGSLGPVAACSRAAGAVQLAQSSLGGHGSCRGQGLCGGGALHGLGGRVLGQLHAKGFGVLLKLQPDSEWPACVACER